MKSKIKFSRFSIAVTVISIGAIYIGCMANLHNKPVLFTLLSVLIILLLPALFYSPVSISADSGSITINHIFRSRSIPMHSIKSVELFQPTMGTIRVFGSGGFMGYWGIFREGDIGRYTAYYGKSSDCFLIRTKDGSQYVLGCENPDAMVRYIKSCSGRLS